MWRVVNLGTRALVLLALLTGSMTWANDEDALNRAWDRASELHGAGKLKEAAPLYGKALQLALRVHGENHADTASILNDLGNLSVDQGDNARAEPLFQRSLRIREKVLGKDDPAIAHTLSSLAMLYQAQEKYAAAEPLLQRGLRIFEKARGPDHPDVAFALNSLALLYQAQGKHADAEPLYQRSLRINEKAHGPDHPDVAGCLNNLAGLYANQGKYAQAEPLYQRGLRIYEKAHGPDHPDVAYTLDGLAMMYQDQGKYAAAEPLYQRTVRILEKAHGPDHPDVVGCLNNLAGLYSNQGKHAQAEPLYQRGLRIKEKAHGPDHPDVARSLDCLALLYQAQEKYADAQGLYQRSLRILEKAHGPDHPDVARSLNGLALMYRAQGKYPDAEPHLQRGLRIAEKAQGKDHPDVAHILEYLALLYQVQGKYADAEPLLQRGLRIYEKAHGPDHPDVARTLHLLAHMYADLGKNAEAQRLQTRLRQATRAFLLRELPSLSPAEQRAFLDIAEEQRFAVALSLAYRQPQDAALRAASAAWLLNGKAIGLEAQTLRTRLQRDADDAAGRALLAELATLRRREADLALRTTPDQADAITRERAALEGRRRDLEKRLAERGGAATALARLWIDLDELRKALPADAVLVDIARFEPERFAAKPGEALSDAARYVAWVIPSAGRGDLRMIDLGDAQEIDDAIAAARKALEAAPGTLKAQGEIRAEQAVREPLARLSKLVLEPLRPHLDKVNRWVISPDGALWLAPWAALPLDDKTYAVEKHTIQLVLSGRDLLPRVPVPGRTTAPALFADPDFDGAAGSLPAELRGLSNELKLGRIARLPGTATEAEAVADKIAKVFGAAPAVFTESKATSAAFLALKRPRALTLATHGFFLPDQELDPKDKERLQRNPEAKPTTRIEDPLLRCGLLMAGCNKPGDAGRAGVLTGHEVLSADLRGCELVILSACETGLGDVRQGEGVAGLRQAFQLAGAESVLASLWKVPDDETTLQMVAFMDALAKGKDRVEALAEAQRKRITQRREKFGAAHPFNWAAFSLTGSAGLAR